MDVCFVLLTRARVSLGVNDARIMMARMHGVWRRGSEHVVRSAAPATRHPRARETPGPHRRRTTAKVKPTVGCRLPGASKAEGRFLVLILEKIVLWGPAIRGSGLGTRDAVHFAKFREALKARREELPRFPRGCAARARVQG